MKQINDLIEAESMIEYPERIKNNMKKAALLNRANIIEKTTYIKESKRNENDEIIIHFHNKTKSIEKTLILKKGRFTEQINGDNKEVDESNSSYVIAYYFKIDDKGVPVGGWIKMSDVCKMRKVKRIRTITNEIFIPVYCWQCKTFKDGIWQHTDQYVIGYKLTPTERRREVRKLYKKGVTTKALQKMFTYKSIRHVQEIVKGLKKKCKYDL